METFFEIYPSAVGELIIIEKGGKITYVAPLSNKEVAFRGVQKESALIHQTFEELTQFFGGDRVEFDIPLDPQGTAFQKSVWKALLEIPYGKTCSYKEIAIAIGNPKAVRAVGMANNRNPISFIIPCHRVIGADGSLVGYGGGLELKKWLLDLEREVAITRQL